MPIIRGFGHKAVFVYIFLLGFSWPMLCKAQGNLIVNGSFEILNSCPQGNTVNSTIGYAKGWRNPVDTSIASSGAFSPDLFNRCNHGDLGVPVNWYGFQEASQGDGYVGLRFYNVSNNFREFIQYKLDTKLISGRKYLLEFDFCFGYTGSYKCDNICFALTVDRIEIPSMDAAANANYFPGLSDSDLIEFDGLLAADTVNWFHFSKEFVANSDAEYLTVGNVKPNSEIQAEFGWFIGDVVIHPGSNAQLDNISLVCMDTLNCDNSATIIPIGEHPLIIFPNPANVSLSIKSSLSMRGAKIQLFDYLGKYVLFQTINDDLQSSVSLAGISAGLYFFRISNQRGTIWLNEKLIISQ